MLLPEDFKQELQKSMSLSRLAKTGLFQKLGYEAGDGSIEVYREIKLHRAVLDKALIDSFSDTKSVKEDVDKWLNLNNREFIEACERALLDPKLVFKTFKVMKEVLQGKNAKFRKFGQRSD